MYLLHVVFYHNLHNHYFSYHYYFVSASVFTEIDLSPFYILLTFIKHRIFYHSWRGRCQNDIIWNVKAELPQRHYCLGEWTFVAFQSAYV